MTAWIFSHWLKHNTWETSFPISFPKTTLAPGFFLSVTLSFLTTVSLDSPQRSRTSTSHQASYPHSPSLSARPRSGRYCAHPIPSATPLAMDTRQSLLCASRHSETFLGSMMSAEERPPVFLGVGQGPQRKLSGSINQPPSHIYLSDFPLPIPSGIVYSRQTKITGYSPKYSAASCPLTHAIPHTEVPSRGPDMQGGVQTGKAHLPLKIVVGIKWGTVCPELSTQHLGCHGLLSSTQQKRSLPHTDLPSLSPAPFGTSYFGAN